MKPKPDASAAADMGMTKPHLLQQMRFNFNENNENITAMASLTREPTRSDPTRPDPRMDPIRVHLWNGPLILFGLV